MLCDWLDSFTSKDSKKTLQILLNVVFVEIISLNSQDV